MSSIEHTIEFSGEEVSELIKSGTKLVTLRRQKYDHIEMEGKVVTANCKDDGEKFPIRVCNVAFGSLNRISPLRLALDGYGYGKGGALGNQESAAKGALRDLKAVYSEIVKSPININFPTSAILFLPEERFQALSPNKQELLLNEKTPLNHLYFREVVVPSVLRWSVIKNVQGIENIIKLLCNLGIETAASAERFKTPDGATYLADPIKRLDFLNNSTGGTLYKNFILHQFSK